MTNKLHAIGNLTPFNDTLTEGVSDVLPFYLLDAPKSFRTLQLVSTADLVPRQLFHSLVVLQPATVFPTVTIA